ncbi:uncharacterized protein LOC133528065 isoform X2 [Cydia pomonella]|uniref:uncharacterized protein LOC133528065 isoform X2 n=1 Tax=Cydia pomonella TaxID=82600 RepID=UPI002ADD9BC8|nr:uncharacterized protein LOC133528065 isoform X2 [Cydia pomonella]
MRAVQCLLVLVLLLWQASAGPAVSVLGHDPSSHPPALAAVSELTSRVASKGPRLNMKDARFPIPGPQDIEAIKKVAQILAMLGEQVIPAIIGEPSTGGACDPVEDAPNDTVTE